MATTEEPIELAVSAAAVHRDVKQAAFAPTSAGQAAIAPANGQTELTLEQQTAAAIADAAAADAYAYMEAAAEAVGEEAVYAEAEPPEPQNE